MERSRGRAGAAATLILSALPALGGCGFHLEGRAPLPATVKTPYLEAADRQSDFVQSLERVLLANGAQFAPEKNKASAVVTILKDNLKQRVLSVSNLNQPNEYRAGHGARGVDRYLRCRPGCCRRSSPLHSD